MTHPYSPPDPYVWLNLADASLFPIRIDQFDLIRRTYRQYGWDEPTDWPEPHLVDGYGLPPDQQKFTRETTPQGLIDLERTLRNELKPKGKTRDISPVRREIQLITRYWETLNADREKYSEEIAWLERMWYYRLFGKHLYIDGKHTYLTGAYWYFLNYWYLNGNNLPEYRDRDRRWSIGLKFCEMDTTTFAKVDADTHEPIAEEDGTYLMRDTGRRTIMGALFSKARRVGDTSRIESAWEEFGSRTVGGKLGIQGMSEENASTVFQEHLVYPFIKIPVFFKPVWDAQAGLMPKNTLLFDDTDSVSDGLHTIIDFASSSDKAAYDGKFLHRLHLDEAGKFNRSDINDVVDVAKFCLATGAGGNIHGLASATTTVDEIEDESAGENYRRLTDRSHFQYRDQNGQTLSGLINVFFPASDGLQGYIGPYGESIIDDPTPEQAMFIGKSHGARQFIKNKKAEYRRAKDWNGLAMFTRQHPEEFADCFTPPPKAQRFRRDLIEDRIAWLRENPTVNAIPGDLIWLKGPDSTVAFIPNAEGRFQFSRSFLANETNRIRRFQDTWVLADPTRYIVSVDTYGLNQPIGRKSNGGIVVRWRRDMALDPKDKPNDEVASDRVIVTYRNRPDVDEFNEDVIRCAVFVGGMVYPERNQANTIHHLRRRGYEGLLMYDVERSGKRAKEAGWWNGRGKVIDDVISVISQDINLNIGRHFHIDLLEEFLKFESRKSLTDLDLMSAYIGTLIAERNHYLNIAAEATAAFDVSGWHPYDPT